MRLIAIQCEFPKTNISWSGKSTWMVTEFSTHIVIRVFPIWNCSVIRIIKIFTKTFKFCPTQGSVLNIWFLNRLNLPGYRVGFYKHLYSYKMNFLIIVFHSQYKNDYNKFHNFLQKKTSEVYFYSSFLKKFELYSKNVCEPKTWFSIRLQNSCGTIFIKCGMHHTKDDESDE